MKYPITPESPPIETETQIAPVSDLMGSKAKDIKLSVHIPQELEDKVDEIKEIIKSAVSEYEGVEIK